MLVKILIAGGLAVLTVAVHAVGSGVVPRGAMYDEGADRAAPISAPVTTAFAQTTQDRSVLFSPSSTGGGQGGPDGSRIGHAQILPIRPPAWGTERSDRAAG